jgi:hypothetical protein
MTYTRRYTYSEKSHFYLMKSAIIDPEQIKN